GEQRRDRVQRIDVARVDVAQVVVTARGDEPGLGRDRQTERAQVGDRIRWRDTRVLDAVTRDTGAAQRGEREPQLHERHAVERDAATARVRLAHERDRFVELGQRV